ncbi:DUF6616 family protein [Acinetobacter rudis]|uniref:NIPSNAP domain-containing protein n=1 Tax=Acinetobacter rudis CIP 110305 TaxID=421052 RepID=S3NXH3_9GAMM|nr:DUF6616 family protein [Acinetobacter rudis]EPF71366.1 hypothetical protein F945_02395 [Acinetobacter rudis CIP 110305]
MNHYLIELYTPNAAWKGLAIEERKKYLNEVGTAMSGLYEAGVKALTLSPLSPDVDQTSEHQFLAVWSFPDQDTCDALLAGIKASRWYNYFDHVNAAGKETGFLEHLDTLTTIK